MFHFVCCKQGIFFRLGLGAKWSSRVFLSLRRCLAVSLYQFQEISQISLKLFRESLLFLSVMPNEKRARQVACLSSEESHAIDNGKILYVVQEMRKVLFH